MSKLEELCSELDLQVLRDWAGLAGESARFALGAKRDRAAGVPGFVVTPWFTSREALERHCDANHAAIVEEGVPEC